MRRERELMGSDPVSKLDRHL